ncbi:MAG: DEAD/DEAH box helicase [Actinobacteria bacterium]|uniref:Probable DNA 3'-5' helicase RecG n=1 Tax=freshwater metagenome TaxID=449393 RepID=A0A6J6HR33_9ZZZZ|nr:DEAD/DEAH box helicase [Actinomycetota bacterium]
MLLPLEPLDRVLGDRTAKSFARHLGLKTVADLLTHYPRRYSSRGELTPIADLPIGESVSIVAEIVDVRERRMTGRKGSILEVRITDGNGVLSLTFFNQAWRAQTLKPGVRGLFAGKIGAYQGKLQLTHPDYELFAEEVDQSAAKAWADLPIPIYPAASAVTTWMIARAMGVVLDTLAPIDDEVPSEIAKAEGLLNLADAIAKIHRPAVATDWQAARDTLRFHEAFLLQATLLKRRADNSHTKTTPRVPVAGGALETFDAALLFELTRGQVEIGQQIFEDLGAEHPMNRLLQGEVGSGKTLVAVRAMLAVADSGGQSALIAPTEVLASQHFASIERTLGSELAKKVGLTLLTGQQSVADRKRALLQIVSGKAGLVVGTHALIADKVEFLDLGLIVVDEQHRFGVEQREALRLKGKLPPHVLTMTATPIPRTLAVTVFGDLDVSTLTELPAGRKEITSHVVQINQGGLVARVWARVAEEVAAGRQAFVVCPRIDEADAEPELAEGFVDDEDVSAEDLVEMATATEPKAPLAAALSVAEGLKLNPTLAGVNIDVLHGRMSSEQKAEVMARFVAKEIDVLVSTTVIEVGVDVPNATVMVVLDADRFGISQLHQLRGRVGRGGLPGLCLLLTTAEPGTVSLERLTAVASTTDGFKLSEIDLELRREGDVLGKAQSGGRSSLKLLRVIQDAALIGEVRVMAASVFEADPTLEKHPALAAALERIDQQAQENLAKT